MKRLSLVLALLFAAAPLLRADGSGHTLLDHVTTPTASSWVHSNPTPGELGMETWAFFYNGAVTLDASFDGGATSQAMQTFSGSGVAMVPVCGGCWLRLRATAASASSPVSAGVTVSGIVVPVVTP